VEDVGGTLNVKPQPQPAKTTTTLRRVGLLKDMTNSNNFDLSTHKSPTLSDYPKHPEIAPGENTPIVHVDTPALAAQSLPPMHSSAHSVPALSTYSMDEMSDDHSSAIGRERRARKSVNYAEPSLKV
jgi:hypothetical protein